MQMAGPIILGLIFPILAVILSLCRAGARLYSVDWLLAISCPFLGAPVAFILYALAPSDDGREFAAKTLLVVFIAALVSLFISLAIYGHGGSL